jgi:glycosyltransferase involved in cell wall biosynthesis
VIDPGKLEEQLELAIREILELPWLSETLGRTARERVVERYSLARNIDRLLELYAEVLG